MAGSKGKERIIYYSDPLNDDFAGTGLKRVHLKKNYHYTSRNVFYRFVSFLVYYLIALPVLYVAGKFWRGIRVKGKKRLKALKGKGAFFYGNHTQIADGFMVQVYCVPWRRTSIIADRSAFAIKGIGWLLKMMGMLPVPETVGETMAFMKAIEDLNKRKNHIVIYPEAHIWPFYTGIRPFKENAFVYPSQLLAPVVPFCVTYRKRKIFRNKSPRMDIHIGQPVYPDASLSIHDRAKALRDRTYDFMVETASSNENVEWIKYVRK